MEPISKELLQKLMGDNAMKLWSAVTDYMDKAYAVAHQWSSGGKKWQYELKFRKGGRTLCSLLTRENEAGFLLILGGKEREKFESKTTEFSPLICSLYEETHTYHDGKWLLIPLDSRIKLSEIFLLLSLKRKPELNG